MNDMFNITGCSRFSSLHIVRHISVIKFKERLAAAAAVWFKLMALFNFVGIVNFGVEIGMDLATGLTSLADSASDFDRLSLVVVFLCETFMFFLLLL